MKNFSISLTIMFLLGMNCTYKMYRFAGTQMSFQIPNDTANCIKYNDLSEMQQKQVYKVMRKNQFAITRIFGMMAEQSIFDGSTNNVYGKLVLELNVDEFGNIARVDKLQFDVENAVLLDKIIRIVKQNNFKSVKSGKCMNVVMNLEFTKDIRQK